LLQIMIRLCLLILFGAQVDAFRIQPCPNSHTPGQVRRRYEIGPTCAALASTLSGSPLEFPERFDRWKFLQDFLEGEVADPDVVNRVLYLVLDRSLINPQKSESGSPEMTPDLREKIEALLAIAEDGRVLALDETEDSTLLECMDSILPDPVNEEDAYKSGWDVVMELYGREMVKISEQNPTYEWKVSSALVRLLIQFDFLEKGVLS
jgi:hypothetical protein